MPHTLHKLVVGDPEVELIADMAIIDPSASGNPLPLTRKAPSEFSTRPGMAVSSAYARRSTFQEQYNRVLNARPSRPTGAVVVNQTCRGTCDESSQPARIRRP